MAQQEVTAEEIGAFIRKIADNDIVKFVGAVGSVAGFVKFLVELFSEDSTQKILDRIDSLEQDLLAAISQIGRLINQQTETIREDLRLDTNNDALALARSAENLLYVFRELGLQDAIVEALANSSEASERILLETDPFYIGGLVGSGNVHIDIIRALDPRFYEKQKWVNDIYRLADHLELMIGLIKLRVEATHTVAEERELLASSRDVSGGGRPLYRYFVSHRSHNVVMEEFNYNPAVRNAFTTARRQAGDARLRGIEAELQFLQIPQFEEIARVWRSVPAEHMLRANMWKLLVRPANGLDREIARLPLFEARPRRMLRSRATTAGESPSGADKANAAAGRERPPVELVADARPFVVRVLTSLEFKKKFLRDEEPEAAVGLLAQRILDRELDPKEAEFLRTIMRRLGFGALAAGLVYSKEYAEKFGLVKRA
jgi:hypothetical protein